MRAIRAGFYKGAVVACLAGCSTGSDSPSLDRDRSALQRATLETVLYAGNPLPPLPSAAEIGRADATIAAAAPWERALLEALYPNDAMLQTLAVRDTDGDGIMDFRISDYYGRFLEGDTDLDGDGSDNLLDTAPFGTSDDAAGDGAGDGAGAASIRTQHALYEQHGIVLAERSAEFPVALADIVDDVVNRVFGASFDQAGSLPTLRLIATAESSLLIVDEDSAGDFAQYFPATATMEIYRPGIDAAPVVQLGFIAHEIGHAIQYALDYSPGEQEQIVRHNLAMAPRFHELVAGYGWAATPTDPDSESTYSLFRPQYIAPAPYSYRYRGESVETLSAWLDDIYAEIGEDYLLDDRVRERHVLGSYSLSNPWEWYSDHLIAYVYLAMLDAVAERCTAEALDRVAETLQNVVAAAWPDFRFDNARGAPFQDYLRRTYPIDDAQARYLAASYLPASCRA